MTDVATRTALARHFAAAALACGVLDGCVSTGQSTSTLTPPVRAASSRPADPTAAARDQVWATEMAFAKSMADRDFNAFRSHLSNEVVFFDDRAIEHGAAEVAAAWQPLFEPGKAPPFAWLPDHVEVLASGKLALSTGPVLVGDKIVGRFNSIWRLEAPHTWRIVFDKGERVCAPP